MYLWVDRYSDAGGDDFRPHQVFFIAFLVATTVWWKKMTNVILQKAVSFYGGTVIAVLLNSRGKKVVYVPIKPICDHLGIDWSAQRQRIKRDPVLSEEVMSVVVTTTDIQKGSRRPKHSDMICLPLDFLNGWLFSINAARVREDVRERLIRYQRECYAVLAEAFQEGRLAVDPRLEDLLKNTDNPSVQAYQMALAIVHMARQQILLEGRVGDAEIRLDDVEERLAEMEYHIAGGAVVTDDQASQISQAVKAVAIKLGQQTGRNEFGGVYGELYRKFGITSYKMLPADRFAEAMDYLTDWLQSIS